MCLNRKASSARAVVLGNDPPNISGINSDAFVTKQVYSCRMVNGIPPPNFTASNSNGSFPQANPQLRMINGMANACQKHVLSGHVEWQLLAKKLVPTRQAGMDCQKLGFVRNAFLAKNCGVLRAWPKTRLGCLPKTWCVRDCSWQPDAKPEKHVTKHFALIAASQEIFGII